MILNGMLAALGLLLDPDAGSAQDIGELRLPNCAVTST